MNFSLYEISAQYQQAFLKLADSELDEQTIDDTLEGIEGELEAKATNVAAFIRNLEASTDAIKQAEKQMAERRKSIIATASTSMVLTDEQKFQIDAWQQEGN